MGVGITAVNKRAIVGASVIYKTTSSVLHQYPVRCVDVCAWFRKVVPPTLGPETSPLTATRSIFWPSLQVRDSGARVIYLAFDDGKKIPEMRHRFYETRRYKKSDKDTAIVKWDETYCEADGIVYKTEDFPASQDEVEALTPHHMPVKWSKQWNSKSGKAKLWNVIIECIQMILETDPNPTGIQYIIDTTTSERHYYPALLNSNNALPLFEYGEGDLKCVMAALHYSKRVADALANKVLILTIDWDVPFITLLYKANIDVLIGRVYMDESVPSDAIKYKETTPSTLQLTRAGADRKLASPVSAYEIIEVMRIVNKYDSLVARQHLIMMTLCIGSFDYSFGLSRFGFTEASLMEVFYSHADTGFTSAQWIENYYDPDGDPFKRYLRIDLTVFVVEVLRKAKRSKRALKSDCINDFSEELHSILFCLCYFGGFDISRDGRGGPPLPDFGHQLFPGVRTVTELVYGLPDVKYEPHFIEEIHPPSTDTIPFDPAVMYTGPQLDLVKQACQSLALYSA